jgi:hypothetical protein
MPVGIAAGYQRDAEKKRAYGPSSDRDGLDAAPGVSAAPRSTTSEIQNLVAAPLA